VIIPCYNYGRFLADCVGSVLAQEGVDVDAIVLDDASTDDSPAVATALAEADPRVTVVLHERNIGHVPTYNEGLDRATGEYIVLISADDLLTRGSLQRATSVMEAHPDVGMVYGNPVIFEGTDVPPARTRGRRVRLWSGADWVSAQCRRTVNSICSPEVCVRASVHRVVGGYKASLPHTGDLELWLRVAAVAGVARVNSDQAYKRVHGRGMIETSFARFLDDLKRRADAYETFFAGPGAHLPHARRDLWTTRRRLAEEALDHVCAELANGAPTGPELDAYVEFARAMCGSEVVQLRQWREYRLARSASTRPAPLRTARLRFGSARREVEKRYGWYRWRLTGM
jgi:GT2 family glycosyltransferase